MNTYLQFYFLCVYIITKCFCTYGNEVPDDFGPTNSAGNFEDFLRRLETNVFSYNKEKVNQENYQHSHGTTQKNIYLSRNENIVFKGQKDVLQDILMMKLVSYYENKYKLSPQSPSTTVNNFWTKTNDYKNQFLRRDTKKMSSLQHVSYF
uniref:Uncharacterized protein n=1 Tax=Bombyx mori TaxID=7091 RepID=A0A8R2M1W7_BOMMO|nr:uncharacterized protein LOC119629341 isoform X2 [Bombyx mori]